jgi:hypothetical protein
MTYWKEYEEEVEGLANAFAFTEGLGTKKVFPLLTKVAVGSLYGVPAKSRWETFLMRLAFTNDIGVRRDKTILDRRWDDFLRSGESCF